MHPHTWEHIIMHEHTTYTQSSCGVGEMAWLIALNTLPEDLGLIPAPTRQVITNPSSRESSTFLAIKATTQTWYTNIYVGKTPVHTKQISKQSYKIKS